MFETIDLVATRNFILGLHVFGLLALLLLLILHNKRREADVPDVFRNLPNWVALESSWRTICKSCSSIDRPEFDKMIFASLVGRGCPTQLPKSIRDWALQLYEPSSGPNPLVTIALDGLRSTNDPEQWMLFLSFLFACEWLIDYPRIWGAPSATTLVEFNRWVTSYKGPINNPDARYLLYQQAAAIQRLSGTRVGNHHIIHPYFRMAGEPSQPDHSARMYWRFRMDGESHEVAYSQLAALISDVKKEGENSLPEIELNAYPKARAIPCF